VAGIGRGFSADGKALLVWAAGELKLMDVDSHQVVWRRPSSGAEPDYADARFTPDGRHVIATMTSGGVRLWEYPSMAEYDIRCGNPAHVAFAGPARSLATIDPDGRVALWSLPPATQPATRPGRP